MMNNNKILTVSYGTFSCTLEGFDDSFGTMKAIAEYFRDLSSEDRYFGAEPAQPDAEMLAHIAQKEISRRVEARQQDGQIVLSAQTPEEPARPAQPAPAPEAAAPPKAPAAPQPQVSSSAAGPSVVSTSFAPRRPKEISAYYDAYRINALKSAEPEAAPAPQAEAAAPRDEVVSREVAAPKPEATQAEAAPASAAPAPEVDIVPGQPDEDVEAFFADSPRNEVTVDDQDAEIQPVAAPVVDSIAAKLQRIRAVVANQDAPAAPQPQVFDDEDTIDAEDSTDDVIANAINDIQGALDADDTVEDIAQSSDLEAEEDVAAAQESEEQHEDVAADEVAEADAAQVDADETGEAEEDTAPRGRVLKVKRADIDRAIAEGELEEVEEDAPAVLEEPEKPALRIQRDPESTLSDEDEEDLARELAELEATLSSAAADTLTDAPEEAEEAVVDEDDAPEEETAEEASQEDTAQEETVDTDVSEDDAEEVQAEVQAETAAEPEAEAPKAAPQRRSLPTLDADSGPDMNRLLAETDNQMDEPEAATRRDAITHLRAAVAAKKADMALGAPDAAERENNAYRSDLAEVVKPRRPASTTARTERPAEPRPAPLKLVAAQRIDTDQPRNVAPVRPRRVAAVAPAPVPQAGGFAEFAEEMGATQLPDLLEAAAAYMAFVEGMDDFSRPQLMNTVRQGGAEDFSREEGLRSFGQLLRTGKLQKLEGGRFKASEQIGFQPDARAAG
jgi:pilus assembly protein FimV